MGATGVIEPTHVRRARARRAARPIAVIAVVGGVLSIAVLARAHWTQSGTGTAAAGVGTLIAPAGVVATPTFGATSVPVSWNGVAAPGGGAVDGYYVQRSSGGTSVAACASSPSTLLPPGAGGCTDAGVPDGTYAYTVTAVFRSWTAGSDPSAPVAVVALASFTVTAPAGATAAVPFSVTVTAKDQSNQTILGYVGTVIITSSDPNGSVPADYTFGPGDDGSHTFTNGVTLDTAGSQTVAVNDAADVWKTGSATVVVAVGAPAQLGFTQQPGGGTAAVAWPTQPKVAIQDAGGNTVTTASASVTLAITSGTGNPSGVLTCTTNPRSTSAGVATFAGCRINLPGTGFTVTASSSGLAAATSAAFDVVAGAPTKVVYVQQPTAAVAGSAINPAIAVAIEDANGNVVTSSNATVTIAIGTNPGGGTLSGTTSVAATNGVATFTDLSIDRAANNYRLAASSAGLTGATSATFNVAAGPAAQLGFTQQPGGGSGGIAWGTQPKVAVQDALGNTVTGASASVTLAITPSTGDPAGALTCNANPKTTNSGVASFGGCKINPPGASYSLTATAAGFDLVLSDPFDISIGPATKLVLTQQPSTVVAGSTIAPAVRRGDPGRRRQHGHVEQRDRYDRDRHEPGGRDAVGHDVGRRDERCGHVLGPVDRPVGQRLQAAADQLRAVERDQLGVQRHGRHRHAARVHPAARRRIGRHRVVHATQGGDPGRVRQHRYHGVGQRHALDHRRHGGSERCADLQREPEGDELRGGRLHRVQDQPGGDRLHAHGDRRGTHGRGQHPVDDQLSAALRRSENRRFDFVGETF